MLASVIGLRAKATAIDVPSSTVAGVLGRQRPAGRTGRGWSPPSRCRSSRPPPAPCASAAALVRSSPDAPVNLHGAGTLARGGSSARPRRSARLSCVVRLITSRASSTSGLVEQAARQHQLRAPAGRCRRTPSRAWPPPLVADVGAERGDHRQRGLGVGPAALDVGLDAVDAAVAQQPADAAPAAGSTPAGCGPSPACRCSARSGPGCRRRPRRRRCRSPGRPPGPPPRAAPG